MHLAKPITAGLKRTFFLAVTLFISTQILAQENSPYSRYGMGDIVPNQNMINRSMGGISAGYADSLSIGDYTQSINLVNPAALGNLKVTVFDLGGSIDIRTLKSNTAPEKFKSVNTLISYLQVGFPLASQKMKRRNNNWTLGFGLKPVTRINYKVEVDERLPNIDSLATIYEGSGGISKVNISTAIKLKNFSFGISSGYSFGTKDYSTKLNFINDSVIYYKSNTATQTRMGGTFLDLGVQYEIKFDRKHKDELKTSPVNILKLGAYANMNAKLKGTMDNIAETFAYDGNGGTYSIDTVSSNVGLKGDIVLPSTYGFGFTYSNGNLLFGADIETTNWKKYRFYGQKDVVQNTFTFRAGAQYSPTKLNTPFSNYWSFVKYRAGFYYGKDYIKIDNTNRTAYAFTAGAGLPLTKIGRYNYFSGAATLNAGVEIGARGNKQSQSLREGFLRFTVGLNMSTSWFIKAKYD